MLAVLAVQDYGASKLTSWKVPLFYAPHFISFLPWPPSTYLLWNHQSWHNHIRSPVLVKRKLKQEYQAHPLDPGEFIPVLSLQISIKLFLFWFLLVYLVLQAAGDEISIGWQDGMDGLCITWYGVIQIVNVVRPEWKVVWCVHQHCPTQHAEQAPAG